MRKRDVEMLALGAALNQAPAPRTEYVTQHVHEHRAPTDDSIRLAAEYEEKAWKKVTRRVIEEIPSIAAKVIACEECYERRGKHLLFSVNERPVRMFLEESRGTGKDQIVREVAETITEEIMRQLFSQHHSPLWATM